MKVIAILNHKGGTGKTTSSLNIGAGLAKLNKKVLLIDIDPQTNLSEGLGVRNAEKSIYQNIKGDPRLPILNITDNLDLIPASIDLLGAELEMVSIFGRETIIKKLLNPIKDNYDYIILDCPPAIGMLTVNAIVASDTLLIPLEAEFYSYTGIDKLVDIIQKVKDNYNENLTIGGVFITKYNAQRSLTGKMKASIGKYFGDKLFDTAIRVNISLSEAQLSGKSVFDYAPTSNGAKDYSDLVNEITAKI